MKKVLMGIALVSLIAMTACNNKKNTKAPAAENQPVEFIRLNVPLTVAPEKVEASAALATELVAASQKDAGMIEYDLFCSETRPGWMLIYETWKDQASLDVHSAAPHFTTLVPQIQAQGNMAIEQFLQVANPAKDGKRIRINCHFTAKDEAARAEIIAQAKELVAATLASDAGVIEYDILSSATRPLELMIYETWKDQAALDAHSAADHFKRLVPALGALSAKVDVQTFYF